MLLRRKFSKKRPHGAASLRRLSVESLEERRVLTSISGGVVLASLENGTLHLTGDAEDNAVEVFVSDGDLVVQGIGTTVQTPDDAPGEADSTAVFSLDDFTAGVFARLGEGNDHLAMGRESEEFLFNSDFNSDIDQDLEVAGDVNILTDGGDDSVELRSLSIGGDLRVSTGSGEDSVRVGSRQQGGQMSPDDYYYWMMFGEPMYVGPSGPTVSVEGDTLIATGRGDDDVCIVNAEFDMSLTLNLGGGDDLAAIGDLESLLGDWEEYEQLDENGPSVTVGKNLAVNGGWGDNVTGAAWIEVGGDLRGTGASGADVFGLFHAEIGRAARLLTGRGDDQLLLSQTDIGGALSAMTGLGDDQVLIIDSRVESSVYLNTGLGDDHVDIERSDFNSNLVVSTGFGDDDVCIEDVEIGGRAVLIGSWGFNRLHLDDVEADRGLLVFGFDDADSDCDGVDDEDIYGALEPLFDKFDFRV